MKQNERIYLTPRQRHRESEAEQMLGTLLMGILIASVIAAAWFFFR